MGLISDRLHSLQMVVCCDGEGDKRLCGCGVSVGEGCTIVVRQVDTCIGKPNCAIYSMVALDVGYYDFTCASAKE